MPHQKYHECVFTPGSGNHIHILYIYIYHYIAPFSNPNFPWCWIPIFDDETDQTNVPAMPQCSQIASMPPPTFLPWRFLGITGIIWASVPANNIQKHWGCRLKKTVYLFGTIMDLWYQSWNHGASSFKAWPQGLLKAWHQELLTGTWRPTSWPILDTLPKK